MQEWKCFNRWQILEHSIIMELQRFSRRAALSMITAMSCSTSADFQRCNFNSSGTAEGRESEQRVG